MKKSMRVLLCLGTASLAVLSSCAGFSNSFVPFTDYIEPINTKFEVKEKGYYKLKEYPELPYIDLKDRELKQTKSIKDFRDIYSSCDMGNTYLNMQSIGEEKLLVLPVSFSDSDKSNRLQKTINIQNAFFGDPSVTVHESVASYYNKSSFGQLKITGEVGEFLDLPFSSYDADNTMGDDINVSKYIVSLAVDNYRKNHPDKIEEFNVDKDRDDFLDGVIVVYDHEQNKNANSLFWAFVHRMNKNESFNRDTIINTTKPYISTYGWMSYYFMVNDNEHKVDAHTFIHEVGHVLGLEDYYTKTDYQPTGCMDMMDNNLGDHNAFSKMLLNWTTPYVITDSTTITLRPSFNTGDCVLIPAGKYNNTPYDEYILLEFYAPEGVNYYDTRLLFSYLDNQGHEFYGKLFSNYGVKAYHIDSRIAYFEHKNVSGLPIAMLDDPDFTAKAKAYQKKCDEEKNGYVSYALDFRYKNKETPDHPSVHLLEASGKNTFINHQPATNDTLFQKGQGMGIDTFKDFVFHNGSPLGYTFEITKITPREATIEFKKI